ncbi:receptor protein-tyrosine kinase [Caerostris darwini]|uniref:Receptor protein-tyrosine kinase n=1 Tax=Caerostris darwini TaxID=1538125 RepID=A0AAV4WGI2_9ARAC|nr:receptor protein-tyrosine kinase [Caerostris darwini]
MCDKANDSRNNGLLRIVPAKVKGGRTVYNVTWGVPVILECTAEGEPPPEITWWQNGVPQHPGFTSIPHLWSETEMELKLNMFVEIMEQQMHIFEL